MLPKNAGETAEKLKFTLCHFRKRGKMKLEIPLRKTCLRNGRIQSAILTKTFSQTRFLDEEMRALKISD